MKFTVFFDGQFWIGLIEIEKGNSYSASRYIFGAEPNDGEVLDFVNTRLDHVLTEQTVFLKGEKSILPKINPKRMKRIAAKEMCASPQSSKSQEVIRLQLESGKKAGLKSIKEQKQKKENYIRQKAVEKAKKKHRGR